MRRAGDCILSITLMIALAFGFLLVCCLAVQLAWVASAPEGWEDETTFHHGPEPYHGAARDGPAA